MAEMNEKPRSDRPRVRYAADEEAIRPTRSIENQPSLSRQNSVASSVRSGGGRRRSIDPALALPIEYRTLSIHVTDTQERLPAEPAFKTESRAAEGERVSRNPPCLN